MNEKELNILRSDNLKHQNTINNLKKKIEELAYLEENQQKTKSEFEESESDLKSSNTALQNKVVELTQKVVFLNNQLSYNM